MRAAQVTSYESPPEFTEVNDPAGGDGMDLVDVEVAGLNPIDLAIASGSVRVSALDNIYRPRHRWTTACGWWCSPGPAAPFAPATT